MVTGPEIVTLSEKIQHLSLSKMKVAALNADIPSHEWAIPGGTGMDNAVSLAECAARRGRLAFDTLSSSFASVAPTGSDGGSALTDRIVLDFGTLLQEMLDFFDSTSDQEIAAALEAKIEESNNIRRLERKLRDARFSDTFIAYAKRTRTDLSVIHRKAELLGFRGYTRLQDRISSVWVNVVERFFPKTEYSPEQQYHGFIDLLYSRCLKPKHKEMDSIDNLLAGIIFDTVAICVIEW
jgi:hypothetical protein